MKKLRTISLSGLDNLSCQEKAKLYGGNDSIPPPTTPQVTVSLPPITSPLPVSFSISPGPTVTGSVTVKF